MLSHLNLHRSLWPFINVLTLGPAAAGLWRPTIYEGIVSEELIPGAFSQDLLSVAAALGLLYFAVTAQGDR
ncbi:hypothetical protein [Arthrobacter flavus]|uniref:Uncharacterized protein n=1 Tax=Arthrobacter flavus TaxID=95172 RepID=A0ABW4QC71_9MICC